LNISGKLNTKRGWGDSEYGNEIGRLESSPGIKWVGLFHPRGWNMTGRWNGILHRDLLYFFIKSAMRQRIYVACNKYTISNHTFYHFHLLSRRLCLSVHSMFSFTNYHGLMKT